MSLETTLKKVDSDINAGNLGKARDRLHGLINTYPNELQLRKKLGDVYWQLQYPSMSGRYWYLEQYKTEDMIKACELFEKEFGNNKHSIWEALKYRGDINQLKSNDIVDVYTKAKAEIEDNSKRHSGCRIIAIILGIALLLFLGVFAIGITSIVNFFVSH